ncbi:hypothetical protein C2S53_017370 [Perilla frutescens var. hirtella]|uniref:Transposase n=1 Tax=Perilla frutescens var. hirtella TaxID=608512 RepID=A0AAD4J7E8_PERFH|nr:hypothetical protein C2S53_017370 [Perilla frutescens var. hirtella]
MRAMQDDYHLVFEFLKELLELTTSIQLSSLLERLKWMAHGPCNRVLKYQGYLIDGVTYHTGEHDDLRAVQNSGVSLVAKTMQVASATDKNPIVADMMFYGIIEEIWELDYNICKFVLFRCNWIEITSGVKVDDLGFTLVNLKKIGERRNGCKTWKNVPKEVKELIWESVNKLSEVQKDRRMKNIYPHRLSHTGYADLAEKMKHEPRSDADIDRTLMWKKARVTKDRDIEDDNLKKAVERISQGMDGDLLTCALEKPEHSGRVRAVGGYVTPSMYFKVPRGGQRGVKHDDFELMEAKKEISMSREMIRDLYEKIAELQTTMKKDKDIEEKGSCSVKWVKSYSKDEFVDDEVMLGKIVLLKLDSSNSHIVAYGTIIAEDFDALLPYPISGVCDNVGDAIGSQVPWPAHLMEAKEKKHINEKVEAKQIVKKRLVKSYESLNSSLKGLYCYAEGAMKNGEGIFIPLEDDVFGSNCEIYIHLEDIIPFCDLDPISSNCMVVYVWYLYSKMGKARTLSGF